jgi:surface polysaccharide O-acyltransferase-like enzyme
MTIDNDTSSRIEILRFPLIVSVVFIHNYTTTVNMAYGYVGVTHSSAWADFIRFFVSSGVARVSVPLFFLISGYLFFSGEWSRKRYVSKLNRRIHTLLIPFVFWNLAVLLIFMVGQRMPQTRMFFHGEIWPPADSSNFFSYIGVLFGITANYPLSIQFWFIRDLMVLVVLAPVVHFLLARKSALPFLVALFGLWLLQPTSDFWQMSAEAAFYFCLGSYLTQEGTDLAYLDKFGSWMCTIILGLLILYSASPNHPFYLGKVIIVFGVPSAWWLAGLAARNALLKSWLTRLSGASFFVFAAHDPLIVMIRKLSYKLFQPASGAAILELYFLIPIGLIAFLVALYRLLLKTMPSFLGLITGSSYRLRSASRLPDQRTAYAGAKNGRESPEAARIA